MKAQTARFKENRRHEKTGIAFALLAVVLLTCTGAHAQMPGPKTTTGTSARTNPAAKKTDSLEARDECR
jgi:hypothetical protein